MSKVKVSGLMLALVSLAALWAAPAGVLAQGGATIQGNIKGADGSPMEGVLVSARASDKSYTTTVFTDRQGNYVFPPLDAGQYKIWAQAVGFEAGRSELALGAGRVDRSFTLTPIKEISRIVKQLSGTELLSSLPQETPADRRMVHAVKNNCTGCHTASFTLQNRWDARGWGAIVDLMTKFPSSGQPPAADAPGSPMMRAYRDELVEYLSRVRGATELAQVKPLPRPTGEATQVVITEFDLPRTDMPLMPFDGSDWSMGTPSRYVGRAAHDVWVDKQGMVWMADDMVPERTLAKLDPATGKVTNYVQKDQKGLSISTHSVVVDDKSGSGRVWATDGNDDAFIAFDPTAEVFKVFQRPPDLRQGVGGTLDVDSKGNPWAVSQSGALKLDVAQEKYTFYPAPKEGGTYGITIDREDNAWYTQPGNETVVKVDSRAGTSTAVVLEPLVMPEILPADLERAQKFRANQNIAPPQQKAPRRTAADPNGDYVWTAEYTGDRLLRIDIKTNQTKEYPLPHAYSQPYATAVDKNGVVWINTINLDRIVRFDPKTERFTEFQLPTRGTEVRHIQVDNRTNPPTIWVPYNRVNKVVRLQFRTQPPATSSRQ